MPENLEKPDEYHLIPRETAALVDQHLGSPDALMALQLIVEYLEMDRTTATDPAVFAGMHMFQNAIQQHRRSMEWHLKREGADNARPSGDAPGDPGG